jgi:dephospho-CoA kinase
VVSDSVNVKQGIPYIVALTGGIASGKTLVSDAFAKLGVPIIDTDVIAHQIVEPGQPALLEIASAFGSQIINKDGRLSREKLRSIIFSEPEQRLKLEAILHPRIRQAVIDATAKVTYDYCIVVIPLLAEKGAYPFVNRILVVDVDPDVQISRLMSRDGSSRKQAEQILASQASRKERLSIADDVLDNSSSPEQAQSRAAQLHAEYLQLATHAIIEVSQNP